MSKHPLKWDGGTFPASFINNPPKDVDGLWVGVCVFCGGSLGAPYEQDLYHMECINASESKLP